LCGLHCIVSAHVRTYAPCGRIHACIKTHLDLPALNAGPSLQMSSGPSFAPPLAAAQVESTIKGARVYALKERQFGGECCIKPQHHQISKKHLEELFLSGQLHTECSLDLGVPSICHVRRGWRGGLARGCHSVQDRLEARTKPTLATGRPAMLRQSTHHNPSLLHFSHALRACNFC